MKKRDLEKALTLLGWWLHHQGGAHERWTNGQDMESLPRHREINELLAKKILKFAKDHPPKEEKK